MRVDLESDVFKDPDLLVKYFEYYGFCKFKKFRHYIAFARAEDSSAKSIVCYFDKDRAYVKDYPQNIEGDIISFIMKSKNLTFLQALQPLKMLLSDEDIKKMSFRQHKLFGGFFDQKAFQRREEVEPIEAAVLDEYLPIGNDRFLKDNISLRTQRYFGIGYCEEEDVITIPIYSENGDLVGVKGRVNMDVDSRSKYVFLVKCKASLTLYGYSQNYEYLSGADNVYVFEAEKSVMQAHTMGIYNAVAIGGSSISKRQSELLTYLNPRRITLMFDEGLDEKVVRANCKTVSRLARKRNIEVCYWKPSSDIPEKSSPTDLGKEKFIEVTQTQIQLLES